MLQGKARLSRTRALSQSRFDFALIDECVHGGPRDPFDDREIRIVHGAARLAECTPDWITTPFVPADEDDSGAWPAIQIEIGELPSLRRLDPPPLFEPDSVLVPFELSPPPVARTGETPTAPTHRPEDQTHQPEVQTDWPEAQPVWSEAQPDSPRAARFGVSLRLAPNGDDRRADYRFDWVRFFGGVCVGGLAAAVLVAVVTAN